LSAALPRPLRRLLPLVALGGLGLLGAAVSWQAAGAKADTGVPLPSVSTPSGSVPSPTVSVPALPLPGTGTDPATTTPATSSSAGSAQGTGATGAPESGTAATPVAGPAGIRGAVRLGSGAVSIPVSSVVLPAHLVIERVLLAPRRIRVRAQLLTVLVRVTDTRGYLVRGALLDVRSVPAGALQTTPDRPTALDGTVSFRVRATALLPFRRGARLKLRLNASQPGQALDGGISAHGFVRVPISPASQ
jgi:hypothetical protein